MDVYETDQRRRAFNRPFNGKLPAKNGSARFNAVDAALAAVAAFGVSRGGNLVIRLVFGMALGFSFFVADNFMLAMGEFGVAPPFLAAWAPFFLFMLVGYTVIFHTEEGKLNWKPAKSTGVPGQS